jgi:N-methylhydantoinase B/oxoprolinase/acetone carboxylase alpha subunit
MPTGRARRVPADGWYPAQPAARGGTVADQLLVIGLTGGGGLGDPRERDPELVRQDVLDGLVSAEQARDSYCVAFTEDGAVDVALTARLRSVGGGTSASGVDM